MPPDLLAALRGGFFFAHVLRGHRHQLCVREREPRELATTPAVLLD